MITALIVTLAVIYLVIFLVGWIENSFPTFKRNRKSFRNFTYFDFILFAVYLPFELLYIFGLGTNPTLGLLQFLKKRPFRKLTFNVGDKVHHNGVISTVLEVSFSENFEERLRLDSGGWFISADRVKKISPLEEVI